MDVKRIFFTENSSQPSFELEDGTIMNPVFEKCGYSLHVKWMTDNQLQKIRAAEEERLANRTWLQRLRDKWMM